ncbi:uncharacterized protein LOC143280150 [Babylonia areolata]|uniref:uncharacterized protein LOC143280150 n=1 Tax=Babylonia areolata TaxID=304850 RepID=UPI003FD2067F
MSNIYIQEPPSNGKVLMKTSVGDIDIELWSKEAPKSCRNFVQLCMEGYYDGTAFHRVVKDFIVQGGDPTDTGEGGESVYGAPFKDEFHQRLRFVRRGLVAMANAGPHDNGSQFFFTMAATPELQNKHTIFGKVVGDTLFNMLKLQEVEVKEATERPLEPHRVISTEVLNNPFDDIVPRQIKRVKKDKEEEKKIKSKSKATKNFSLLSFGDEAEDDEEQVDKATESFRGKSKSSHDLTDDPRLSSIPAVEKDGTEEDKRKKKVEGSPEDKHKKVDTEDTELRVKTPAVEDEGKTKKADPAEDPVKKGKADAKEEEKKKKQDFAETAEKKKSPGLEEGEGQKKERKGEEEGRKVGKEETKEDARKKKVEPDAGPDGRKRKAEEGHKEERKKRRSKEREEEDRRKRKEEGKEEEGRKKRKGEEEGKEEESRKKRKAEEEKVEVKKKIKTEPADGAVQPAGEEKGVKEEGSRVKVKKEEVSARGKEPEGRSLSLLGASEDGKQQRMEELKKEQRKLQRDIKDFKKRAHDKDKVKVSTEDPEEVEEKEEEEAEERDLLAMVKKERQKYKQRKKQLGGSRQNREDATLAMLATFQNKLATARMMGGDYDDVDDDKNEEEDDPDDMSWMRHKLHFGEEAIKSKVLDANVQDDDRYTLNDPRNPLTQRRRESSKKAMRDKR